MIRINQVKVRSGHSEEQLKRKAADCLKIPVSDIYDVKIVRQSIDARKKPDIFYTYTLNVKVKKEEKKEKTEEKKKIKTPKEPNQEDKKLAKIRLMKNLKTIDNSLVNAIGDSEAIEVLMVNKIRKIWENVINGVINIDDIYEEYSTCGKYSKVIFKRFINEYNTIKEYEVPIGFSYKIKKDGETIKPNLMQKLMINRLKKNRYYGNWSGMGSGKTLSAIISSREINSHLTVIICLNSTVIQWANDILNAYPEETGTCVHIAKDNKYDGIKFDRSKYNV